jgi:hypothetical protein
VLTRLGGEDDGADALDLHARGIPKLDEASDIRVKLSEELPSTGHVMGGIGVETPPVSLVVARAVAEKGVCSRLIKVEASRCGRCRWRYLDACVCQEQSWLFLLHLCDVGLAASRLSTLLGPMAKLAIVVVGVVSCRLLVADGAVRDAFAGATLGTSSRPGLGASARLVRRAALAGARRERGLPLLPVILAGLPLFLSEMQLPADGGRSRERLWFIIIDDLEATYRLFDRHRGEVQQRLDRASDLLVLLGDAPEELLDGSLLVVGVIAELHHLLLQSIETESKVINVAPGLKARFSHSLRSACSVVLRARSLPMRAAAMASQTSLAVRFLESENCISGGTAAMRASSARRSS